MYNKSYFRYSGNSERRLLFIACLSIFLLLSFSLINAQATNTLSSAFNLKNNKNNSLFYVQEDGKIGIGLTNPGATLHILGNDGVVFTGTYNSGNLFNMGAGMRMFWYPRKGAFRSGYVDGTQWDDRSIGLYSFASGYITMANGDYATALGINNTASGQASIALGRNSVAANFFSTAIGFYASALGESSFSLGYQTTSSGKYSFALGHMASTNSRDGAFILSDASAPKELSSSLNNEMTMRFSGGYRLFSDKNASMGVLLSPDGYSWASILDSTKRGNFLAANSEDVLKKINQLRTGSWSLKAAGITANRHYGISAQEFFHAFGHDSFGQIGNDSTITTSDFDGITLIALQGLERRTTTLNNNLSSIDTLVTQLKIKDSLLTKVSADVELLQNKLAEKDAESQKLIERLDKLESIINDMTDPKAKKSEDE